MVTDLGVSHLGLQAHRTTGLNKKSCDLAQCGLVVRVVGYLLMAKYLGEC